MNLRLFMPYPELRVRFENICFKVMLFSAVNKKIGRKLRNNNRCKIVSRKLSRLNISYVDRAALVSRSECSKFFFLFPVH